VQVRRPFGDHVSENPFNFDAYHEGMGKRTGRAGGGAHGGERVQSDMGRTSNCTPVSWKDGGKGVRKTRREYQSKGGRARMVRTN